jgi:prolyl oligopeptidase
MRRFLPLLLLVSCVPSALFSQSKLPSTPVRNVVDEYFGTKITDPYRWLENGSDPEVVSWMKGQNDYTRQVLAGIPGRQKFLDRVSELDKGSTRVRLAQIWGGKLFYLKTDPGADNSKLYVREGDKERLLVDTEPLTKDNVHYSIDYFAPSLDGNLMIYGVSAGGSENSVLHVIETTSGRVLPDEIDRTRFGIVTWLPGNKSFVYNRLQKLTPDMPKTAFEQRSKVYLHKLGDDPEKDTAVFGYGYDPALKIEDNDISFMGYSPAASSYIFGGVAHGTENEITIFYTSVADLSSPKVSWKKAVDVSDGVVRFDVRGDDVYVVTHKNHPRYEVLKLSLKNPDLAHAQVVVPASDVVIQEADVAQDAIYIRDLDGGIGRMRKLSFSGKIESVPLADNKSVSELSFNPTEPGVLVHTLSWTNSPLWLKYDPATKTVADTKIQPPIPVDTLGFESVEVKAKSADGTMVPLSIIRPKGAALDGSHPTHLMGYGAYGISLDPFFDPVWVAWLERGGVIGIAHVRGGGEYGEEWYRAGYKLTKQHTIDDFIASAQYMIDNKYTTPKLLSGEGTSAGGILIGGAITQRPDLFGAALIRVGCSNALRMEFEPNGPPNIAEFGTVKEADGFKGLFAMDAYQHVKDGTAYPAVLLTAGANDPRVDPAQAAKMTARLQAATSSGKPVLLRVDYDAGHGMGSTRSQHDIEYADEASFLLWHAGAPEFQPTQ